MSYVCRNCNSLPNSSFNWTWDLCDRCWRDTDLSKIEKSCDDCGRIHVALDEYKGQKTLVRVKCCYDRQCCRKYVCADECLFQCEFCQTPLKPTDPMDIMEKVGKDPDIKDDPSVVAACIDKNLADAEDFAYSKPEPVLCPYEDEMVFACHQCYEKYVLPSQSEEDKQLTVPIITWDYTH